MRGERVSGGLFARLSPLVARLKSWPGFEPGSRPSEGLMLIRCTTRMKKSRRLELHQHRVGLRNRCLPQSATSAFSCLNYPSPPTPLP